MTTGVTARFRLARPDGSLVEEDAAVSGPFGGFTSAAGTVTLEADGVSSTFADTLLLLAGRLCLRGPASLRRDGRLDVDFYDHDEQATLAVAAGRLEVSGSDRDACSFPAEDALAALSACGERYVALARLALRGTPEEAAVLADLDRQQDGGG